MRLLRQLLMLRRYQQHANDMNKIQPLLCLSTSRTKKSATVTKARERRPCAGITRYTFNRSRKPSSQPQQSSTAAPVSFARLTETLVKSHYARRKVGSCAKASSSRASVTILLRNPLMLMDSFGLCAFACGSSGPVTST